jgi:hypothetical protein
MFLEKLKRQYFGWCLFACGIGLFNIIENVRTFNPLGLLVNALMVLTLAFICYCIAFGISAVLTLLGIDLQKLLSQKIITKPDQKGK